MPLSRPTDCGLKTFCHTVPAGSAALADLAAGQVRDGRAVEDGGPGTGCYPDR